MLKSFLFWGNGDWAQGNHLSCARKSSGASADWAQSHKSFAWTTSVLRQFRTVSAKQGRSSLLFMTKRTKPGTPPQWVPDPHRRSKRNNVPLGYPLPTSPSGSIKCLSGKKKNSSKLFSILLFFICQSKDIICADLIIFG